MRRRAHLSLITRTITRTIRTPGTAIGDGEALRCDALDPGHGMSCREWRPAWLLPSPRLMAVLTRKATFLGCIHGCKRPKPNTREGALSGYSFITVGYLANVREVEACASTPLAPAGVEPGGVWRQTEKHPSSWKRRHLLLPISPRHWNAALRQYREADPAAVATAGATARRRAAIRPISYISAHQPTQLGPWSPPNRAGYSL